MSAKLTASGQITRTQAAAVALAEAGQSTARLLIRHLRGDRGQAGHPGLLAQAGDRVISHYGLPDGKTVVVVTHYPTEPTLRWTEFCLAPELAVELIELALEEADAEENFDPAAAGIEGPDPPGKMEEPMKPPVGIFDRHAR